MFNIDMLMDSCSPIGVEDRFHGNDDNGSLSWAAFF